MTTDLQSRFDFDQITADRFLQYHLENPGVYQVLKRFALEAKRSGRTRIGINEIHERARWHTQVETRGDSFKLNNSYRPYYARLLQAQEPELAGFFETRKAKADQPCS